MSCKKCAFKAHIPIHHQRAAAAEPRLVPTPGTAGSTKCAWLGVLHGSHVGNYISESLGNMRGTVHSHANPESESVRLRRASSTHATSRAHSEHHACAQPVLAHAASRILTRSHCHGCLLQPDDEVSGGPRKMQTPRSLSLQRWWRMRSSKAELESATGGMSRVSRDCQTIHTRDWCLASARRCHGHEVRTVANPDKQAQTRMPFESASAVLERSTGHSGLANACQGMIISNT